MSGPMATEQAESNRPHMSSSLSGGRAPLSHVDVATSAVPANLATQQACDAQDSKLRTIDSLLKPAWPPQSMEVGIFQGWNAVVPLVLDVNGAVYLPHPSHTTTSTHYTNAMANNEVEIILTDSEDDT
ncbi:hypothetical protein EDD18DRAFT_1361929 [Armillaria luteobubalina]|uniref:Uncharacterized protein n=1 Tax=Armillaria luteobubalina TaxID=153913 RepID=A0AA39PGY7_9AGAR|nr:hypothetical protein EDD18DRAFT_1361929 [Armillaria luteobubalina]